MAQPVLVTAYKGAKSTASDRERAKGQRLPPVSAYSFADILRSVDSPEVQAAIEGIAEICAKNRMSLAEEYASHLPPVGEITDTVSVAAKPHLHRLAPRRPLTSVPEASSSSSNGSLNSRHRSMFGFGRRQIITNKALRTIRIGSMGRTVSISGTTAVSSDGPMATRSLAIDSATLSLRRLLLAQQVTPD